ncbi:uncharacterized protein LOC123259500 [Cotesia glomerata]|uniref:Uncharacterized protein n=1 Tax=Cotesia glomerata TaxID=32391 RepID=A0AAV7HL51_COTGL|nr:uncharacterized protein LOC123259500 [Cotesia glomerata]KAH0540571.1 hypothetical protein KQX54_018335 [Cotesia glomerata]
MFRLIIFSIVMSLIFISVMSLPSYQVHPIELINDEPEEISIVNLEDGDYVVKLITQLTDCNLENKTHDSEELRTELESLYKETLVAHGLSNLAPDHLEALRVHRKEKCTLKVWK